MHKLLPTEWAKASQPLRILTERLGVLFRYVEPTRENIVAFSHEARALIILAATEVEANLRAVLRLHYPSKCKDRMTMVDYVDAVQLLRLAEWQVQLVDFPAFGSIGPYLAWDPTQPTKSLPWYQDYHAIKHDRDAEFHRASVGCAIDAVAAAAILLISQFGWDAVEGDRTLATFRVTKFPSWEPESDYPPPWLSADNSDILDGLRYRGARLSDFAARWRPRPISSVPTC